MVQRCLAEGSLNYQGDARSVGVCPFILEVLCE